MGKQNITHFPSVKRRETSSVMLLQNIKFWAFMNPLIGPFLNEG